MKRNFAILAGAGDPLFGYYLEALERHNIAPTVIIVDQKAMTAKDLGIFAERTLGRIQPLPPPGRSSGFYRFVANHNDEDTLRLLRDTPVDFLVNVGTPRILKAPILKTAFLGVLNCHPGLLPDFRGCSCVEWAIYLNKPVGVTVHRMTEGIDEGPVLLRRQVNISPGDEYVDVRIKTYMEACAAIAKASLDLVSGYLNESDFTPQSGGHYFSPWIRTSCNS